jgi:uncharacterized protein (DUF2236 family)
MMRRVSSPVLPPREEWARLAPAPGSVVWRRAGDPRVLLTAGYALLLQVAHPTVGAGVSEHSSFRADPWGRLLRTLDAFYGLVYGGPEAAGALGRRLHAMHLTITGVAGDGPYSAVEPEAYAWVHATLAMAVVRGHAVLGRRLDAGERERFWLQWRGAGRLVGVRQRDLPSDWHALEAYFEEMVGNRLKRTSAVDDVLDTLHAPGAPPLPFPLRAGWPLAGAALAHVHVLVTIGLLPPLLRDRFGLAWGRASEVEFGLLARALRAATPALSAAQIVGPAYLRLRR